MKKTTILLITTIVTFFIFLVNSQKTEAPSIETTNPNKQTIQQKIDYSSLYISIDKINIEAPIILNVDSTDKKTYFLALESGVAHMRGTGLPFENSNCVIYAHSSHDSNYKGEYGEIFSELNKLENSDTIKIRSNNFSQDYIVSDKKIVESDNLDPIEQTNKEELTLITCWPMGTDAQRLIIKAVPK